MSIDIDDHNIKRLDGGLLLVFRELLRNRSATKSAARLNLSQSAISHALSRLRDILGDPLFVRRPHGLEPTRRALELGPQIDELIDLTATLVGGRERFDPARSKRTFKISAPEFVTALVGTPLIEVFQRDAPGATFRFQFRPEEAAFDGLRRGDLDLALGRYATAAATTAGLASEVLYHDRYCVVARRDHPYIRRKVSEAAYLEAAHVFAASASEVIPAEARGDYSRFNIAATVPYWLTALVLVSTSDAIATCSRRLAERLAEPLALRVLEPPFDAIPFEVSLVRRDGDRDGGKAWFANALRRAV